MAIRIPTVFRAGLLVAATVLLPACEAGVRPTASYSIEDLVSSVTDQSGTVSAVLHRGAPPTPSTADTTKVAGIAMVINGGTSPQTVQRTNSFTRIIVAGEGLTDYYELTLPAGQTSQGLLLGLSQQASAGQLYFDYAAGDGSGLGQYARQLVRILPVGTGDLQISASWTDTADVDLHVVDPNGDHVYFGNRSVASGGNLDLDGNAACGKNQLSDGSYAHVSNENVTWPTGQGINGSYTVYLDYWSDCGVAQTDWVVTVQKVGSAAQTFTGSFVGSSSGIPDDTVTVVTF